MKEAYINVEGAEGSCGAYRHVERSAQPREIQVPAGRLIWMARLRRLWRAYLRLASALAGLIGGVILTLQYFILLPFFALVAQRAARREAAGWTLIAPERNGALGRQY